MEDAGIFLTSNIIWTGGPVAVQHATEELYGFDVLNIINKSVTVDASTETLALQAFAASLTSLPAENAIRSALSAAFAEHRFGDVQASPGSPVSSNLAKAWLTAEASWLQRLPVDEIPPHPSATNLYGAIPVDAVRNVNQDFSVDVRVAGLIATATYAVPGEVVTIEVPAKRSSHERREVKLAFVDLLDFGDMHRGRCVLAHAPRCRTFDSLRLGKAKIFLATFRLAGSHFANASTHKKKHDSFISSSGYAMTIVSSAC